MRKLLFVILLPAVLFAQAGGQPIQIPIQNPSFEAPVIDQYQNPCGLATMEPPPGWSGTASGIGILTPLNLSDCTFSAPPDGSKMVVLDRDGAISQVVLTDIYAQLPHDQNGEVNGIYSLTFSVANFFYWYDGAFSVALELGQIPNGPSSATLELCKTTNIAMGDFQKITLTCLSQRKYGQLSIVLSWAPINTITLPNPYNSYPVLFDNVSLTFTPTN